MCSPDASEHRDLRLIKRKVGKGHEEGSKKRKEVGNDNSLACMFAKQQAARDLNKA